MKKMALFTFLLAFTVINISAQNRPDLLDPEIRYGVLENGLTYYLIHNEEPKERASFYLVQNVGAILEEDDQNGLAHMLEHMAFNGSDNFEGKGIKDFLERQGVEFGSNINAYTNQDETVYNFSNVPSLKSEVMDTCVMILHDWSGSLTLAGEEIDAERGVIKEEWRTRNSAGRRMNKKLAPTTFYNSQYAVRDVIGDMDVVENSPYDAIRSFYEKWYRTDLQAVVIAGDFDLDQMEARVTRILSTIPAQEDPAFRTEYPVGDNDGILYDYATDAEAQYVRYTIITKFPSTKPEDKSEAYLRDDILAALYGSMIQERLAVIAKQSDTPFLGPAIGYYGYVRSMSAYYMAGVKPEGAETLASMEALLIENERILRHGFTETELERAKIKYLKSYEEAYKNRNEVSNDRRAIDLKNHYLVNEPKPGIAFMLEFVQTNLPEITLSEVNALAKKWNKEDNIVVTINGPEKEGLQYPNKDQIIELFGAVKIAAVEPFVDEVITEPLIAKEPTPGKVVSTSAIKGIDAKEYTLSNGARVVIYPTDKNDNQILFNAYSKGGSSLLKDDEMASVQYTPLIADWSGIGNFSQDDLKKLLVGKQVALGVSINQFSESLNGSTTPEDIETLLKLIYLSFEQPRFDQQIFENVMGQLRLSLENRASAINSIFNDSIQFAVSGGNTVRRPILDVAALQTYSLAKSRHIYQDRIQQAGDFVFVFVGAVDEAKVLPMIEQYIGGISDEGRRENWKDDGVRPFSDGYSMVFASKMETPKQKNYIRFQGKAAYNRERELVLNIAKSILQQRYFETIREEEGGSYGVRVFSGMSIAPYDNFSLGMMYDSNPDKAEKLMNIIYSEVEKLLKEGPSEADYQKAIEVLVKNREQGLEENRVLLQGLMSQYTKGYNTLLSENFEDILSAMTIDKFSTILNEIMSNSGSLSVIMQPEQIGG